MLSYWTWTLLLSSSALTVAYVIVTNFTRKRRQGEPPVVKGHPVWGSAADFSKNAVGFLQDASKEYGDIFTIRLVNQYLTIIMDPHSYEAMTHEKNFDFDPIQKQVNWNVFSFVLKEPRKMIKDTGKTVRGPYLQAGLDSFVSNLDLAYERVANGIEKGDAWKTDGLRLFTAKTIFDSIFNTVFGRDDDHPFTSEMVFRNFEIFHKYFNYFWLGMPKSMFPAAMRALGELLTMPDAEDLMSRANISDYINTAIQYMQKSGQTENDIKGHNLVYLHVNYNTFRLAFWALSNLLEDEKARQALTNEIDTVIQGKRDSSSHAVTFSVKDIEGMKVLDSIVQESFRLASGVFMVRYITQDTEFTTPSGKTHLMREGDRVAIYPPAIHKDAEIFPKPLEFQYDRFIDQKFYKNGEEISHPVMAFGSLCPGKRYALLQIKWYLITVLNQFEMRLQENEHAEYDYQYHGHEILPPVEDVQIDFRAKPNAVKLEVAHL